MLRHPVPGTSVVRPFAATVFIPLFVATIVFAQSPAPPTGPQANLLVDGALTARFPLPLPDVPSNVAG